MGIFNRSLKVILLASVLIGALIGVTFSNSQGYYCAGICCWYFPTNPTLCQDCCDPCCASANSKLRQCLTVCYAICLNCPKPPPYPMSTFKE